jgi:hypothetical protein
MKEPLTKAFAIKLAVINYSLTFADQYNSFGIIFEF